MHDTISTISSETARSLLKELRGQLPDHEIGLSELLTLLGELATGLRTAVGVTTDALPAGIVRSQRAIRIEDTAMPLSGYRFWDPTAKQWVIRLNEDESSALRRFTVMHEFGHILWHGWESSLFPGLDPNNRGRLAEFAADIFAGEVLMPKRLVLQAHRGGMHNAVDLARHFGVTSNTMRWKLAQLDLPAPTDRDRYTLSPSIRPGVTPLVEAPS